MTLGIMTLSITSLNLMTLSMMALNRPTLIIMTLSKMTFSIKTLSKTTLGTPIKITFCVAGCRNSARYSASLLLSVIKLNVMAPLTNTPA